MTPKAATTTPQAATWLKNDTSTDILLFICTDKPKDVRQSAGWSVERDSCPNGHWLVATDTWLSVSPAVFPQGELAVATDGRRECGWNVKQKKPTNKCINICIIHKTKKTMDKQKDKPLYVAFSTQKGGAGKTTLTVLVASYLHYVKGYDVAVIDCDFP